MRHFAGILGLVIFLMFPFVSKGVDDSTKAAQKKGQKTPYRYQLGQTRTFKDLEETWMQIPLDTIPNNPITTIRKPTQKALSYIKKARATMQKIKDNKLYTFLFNPTEQVKLPIGIHKKMGNIDYTIGIDSIVVTPNYTYLVAYMIIENSADSSKLYFIGNDIRVSKKGGLSNARLELGADYAVKTSGGKGQLIFRANTTQVTFDCSGFQSMSVDASVVFSKDWFLVEKPNGSIDTTKRVTGDFRATLTHWTDLVATVNFRDPFQVKDLPGYGFTVKQASFDFSDSNSPAGMQMPAGYLEPGAENLALWRGFYLRELELRLPPSFKSRDSTRRTPQDTNRNALVSRKTINIQELIIDHNGISGKLRATNLLSLEQGDMGKWQYSLDSLGFEIVKNQLISAGFSGRVVLPITKKEEKFTYKAIIRPKDESYEFVVSTASKLSFPVFKAAQVDIHPSSYLEVKVVRGSFLPRACLTGKMAVTGSMGSKSDAATEQGRKMNFPSISFTELEIMTVSPYVKVKAFSFTTGGEESGMAGFPVSIKNLGIKTYSDGTALEFDLLVNFTKSSDGGFSAQAGLSIVGEMKEGGGLLSYQFKRVDVKRISIDIDQGNFALKGALNFFKEDETYGNGFQALIGLTLKKPKKIEVKATALFGTTVKGMRYWYADAAVLFDAGVPFLPPLQLNGLSGGAYYKMKQSNQGASAAEGEIGVTQTGVRYVPDEKSGLGIRAGINFSTQAAQAFKGDATLELSFNDGGGLQRIFFSGNAYLTADIEVVGLDKLKEVTKKIADKATELDKYTGKANIQGALYNKDELTNVNKTIFGEPTEKGKKSQVSASVHIDYNIDERTLDGSFSVFINAAGGTLKGAGPKGLAGAAILHFAPDKWYIRVGSPDQRMGIDVLSIAKMRSYLMVGNDIPGSPPPPQAVSDILGGQDLDYMRDMNALGMGSGFAFGADLSIDTGELKFLMFYARLMAGAGFDIMVKNYGEDVHCEGSNDPIGINGWYANGQVYAYVQGEVGMEVDLKFYKGRYKILSIAAAAVLQAKLPRPTWMRGIVGGRFDILGGLVSGNCKFEMTLGRECKIVGTPASPVAGLQIISDLTPKDQDTDIDVFTNPQAVFNMEVGKVFEIQDLEGNNRAFRVKLDKMEVKEKGQKPLAGILQWNADKTVLAFTSTEVLPSEKAIVVEVQASFEERVNGNWKAVLDKGTVLVEKRMVVFKSGKAPDYIPASNVAYSYPVDNQLHYYKEETPEGYIKLLRGQKYLFEPSTEWDRKGKISSVGGGKDSKADALYFDIGYNIEGLEVFFERPEKMELNKIYTFELVNVPLQDKKAIDSNIESKYKQVGGDSSKIKVRENVAEGNLKQLQEKSFYTMHFKTSRFDKFVDKMNAFTPLSSGWSWPVAVGIHEIGISWKGTEFFDKFELSFTQADRVAPLVQGEADPNSDWMSRFIQPLNYQNYPNEGITIDRQGKVALFGVPPLKAISLSVDDRDAKELTAQHLQAGVVQENSLNGSLVYGLALPTYHDYFELRNKVAARGNYMGNAWMSYLMSNDWVSLQPGKYPLKLSYKLPGKGRVTSEWYTTIVRP